MDGASITSWLIIIVRLASANQCPNHQPKFVKGHCGLKDRYGLENEYLRFSGQTQQEKCLRYAAFNPLKTVVGFVSIWKSRFHINWTLCRNLSLAEIWKKKIKNWITWIDCFLLTSCWTVIYLDIFFQSQSEFKYRLVLLGFSQITLDVNRPTITNEILRFFTLLPMPFANDKEALAI